VLFSLILYHTFFNVISIYRIYLYDITLIYDIYDITLMLYNFYVAIEQTDAMKILTKQKTEFISIKDHHDCIFIYMIKIMYFHEVPYLTLRI